MFLEFFIMQRTMNLTTDLIAQMHETGVKFMETAKRVFPERNGAQNRDGSPLGWKVWKFHSILHRPMDILRFGWTENVSTQCGESAHKVIVITLLLHRYSTVILLFTCFMSQINVKDVQRCSNMKEKKIGRAHV